jgi:ribosomal protein S12 methylthiotransferase accessory factor
MTSEIEVTFPGGLEVDASVGGYVVRTDQPIEAGGAGAAPAPFDLFLASLATCAGIYALGFCRARGLSTDGLRLVQHTTIAPATKLPSKIELRLTLPVGFPETHRGAMLRAVAGCKVKKTIAASPAFDVVLDEARAHASAA